MNSLKRNRLEELKIKASILLKSLHATDGQQAADAAKRFLALPFLKHSRAGAILEDKTFFRLKHALWVVAIENAMPNWNALRNKIIREDCLFHNSSPAFLNIWFNNYEAAKVYQQKHGGYLLQYRKDFIIADKSYIDTIGLGSMAAEWKATGYDWVKPASAKAWNSLFAVAKKNYLAKKPAPAAIDKTKRPAWLRDSH